MRSSKTEDTVPNTRVLHGVQRVRFRREGLKMYHRHVIRFPETFIKGDHPSRSGTSSRLATPHEQAIDIVTLPFK